MQNFHVTRWAAWAPGLDTQDAWRAWLDQPAPIAADAPAQPPLTEMPAMMRRRIDPLGRAALQAAYWVQDDPSAGPVVFASRWGEIARSVALLQQQAQDEPLSPTQFSLSVHNASGALYSMARQDHQNYLAVAAGAHSAEAGVCEALGLLADGAPQVLLVCFDAPLPPDYAALPELQRPAAAELEPLLHAWACVLVAAPEGEGLSLQSLPPVAADADLADGLDAAALPGNLAPLHFLIGQQPRLDRPGPQGSWRWIRHEAGAATGFPAAALAAA